MRVVLDNGADAPEDLELRLGREDATVGDLLDALPGAAQARGIVLDGRFCHVDLALSEIGLYEGARIHPATGAPERSEPTPTVLELRVIAGFDAGQSVPLTAAGVVVGRDADCDLTLTDEGVSRRHLRVQPSPGGLRVTVTDLESVNGTWVEGKRIRQPTDVEPEAVFEAGDVAFIIAPRIPGLPVDPVRQANLAGTIPFNRPPRNRAPAGEMDSAHRARAAHRRLPAPFQLRLGVRPAHPRGRDGARAQEHPLCAVLPAQPGDGDRQLAGAAPAGEPHLPRGPPRVRPEDEGVQA